MKGSISSITLDAFSCCGTSLSSQKSFVTSYSKIQLSVSSSLWLLPTLLLSHLQTSVQVSQPHLPTLCSKTCSIISIILLTNLLTTSAGYYIPSIKLPSYISPLLRYLPYTQLRHCETPLTLPLNSSLDSLILARNLLVVCGFVYYSGLLAISSVSEETNFVL